MAFYSYSIVKPEVVVTTGHDDQINAVAISYDDKFLASASNDKILKIWDINLNREYRSFFGTNGRINYLKFSPNNHHILATTSSNELIVWDIFTGKEVFKTTKCSANGFAIDFINKGEQIIYLNDDNHISKIDLKLKTDTILNKDIYCTDIVIDSKINRAYINNMEGDILYYDLNTYQFTKSIKLFDKGKFGTLPSKISVNGKYIVTAYFDNIIRVFDTQKEKFIYESKPFDKKIMALEIDVKNAYLYFSLYSGEVIFFDYFKRKVFYSYKDVKGFTVNNITAYPLNNAIIITNFNTIKIIDLNSKTVIKYIKPKVSKIWNMAYDQQGKYLAVANNKVKIFIWDLEYNKIVDSINGFFPCEFSPDGKELYSMDYTSNLVSWNTGNWTKKTTYLTNNELIQKIAITANGNYIAGSGYQNQIKIWQKDKTKHIKLLKGHTMGVLALDFHPTLNLLASGSLDGTVKIWDYLNETELESFNDQTINISGVKFSPNGQLLASSAWDKTIYIRQTNNWRVQNILKGHTSNISGLDFNQSGDVLVSYASNNAVSKADNSLIFYKVDNGEQICQIKDHQTNVTKAFFDKAADYVFSCSEDGTVKISDYKKQKVLATYLAIGSKEFMIYTPDNYYIASKNALQNIAFRMGEKLVPFDQFDIYLNRPDIVAKVIGKSPTVIIKAYEYLHKKRLKKYNLDEQDMDIDYHLPHILKMNQIDLLTEAASVDLTLKAWDELYNLHSINIYINGTPIFGDGGYLIDTTVKSFQKTFTVQLMDGVNSIKFSSVNSKGVESIYESFELIKKTTNDKPNLYMVSIGVSAYKNNIFNLTYPSKDAKDMLSALSTNNGLYNKTFTKLLLNENVTLENFNQLIDFFKPCHQNDIAIIFMAGHGVLDENFDYYFGTYNMDFNHPEQGGLPYAKIHHLLNQIKAYRKLLIMDTCHSGELDKEEVERGPDAELIEGNVKFRSIATNVIQKEAIGLENSIEVASEFFSDTRKGSGAIVISSAGGAEYAMESDLWKNGLFTYAFLNGFEMTTNMNNKEISKADFNSNGFVEVSEIRKYAYDLVKKLSNNHQKPTAREENIDQDYIIFKKYK
jgi:WD40 repeat protein